MSDREKEKSYMLSVDRRKSKRVNVGAAFYVASLSLAGLCIVCLCTVSGARVSASAGRGVPARAASAPGRRGVAAPTALRQTDGNSNRGGGSNSNANAGSGGANDNQDAGAEGGDAGNKNQAKPAGDTVSLILSATAGEKEKKKEENPAAAGALDRSVHETHYVRLFFLRKATEIADAINKTKKLSAEVKAMDDGLLFFPSAGGADDETIHEFKRWISLLDVPRPDISLMTWSVQISSGDLDTINRESVRIRSAVSGFNDRLQSSLEQGWWFLEGSRRKAAASFYAPNLNGYLSKRYLWTAPGSKLDPGKKPQPPCDDDMYCLGYTRIFNPIQPSLTSMLLALIAAQPQGYNDGKMTQLRDEFVDCLENRSTCRDHYDKAAYSYRARDDESAVQETPRPSPARGYIQADAESVARANKDIPCEESDRIQLDELENKQRAEEEKNGRGTEEERKRQGLKGDRSSEGTENMPRPGPAFYCFREQLHRSLGSRHLSEIRRTLADFLYQYKSAEYYPRDFVAWNQAASAQALDGMLNPLIKAFNRDLSVYLSHIQDEVQGKHRTEKKATFESDGIVTALVISGNAAKIDTTTQSFFKQPPTLNVRDVVSALEAGTKPSLAPIVTGHGGELIAAAIQAEQRTVAKVSRNLNIDITANTLKGASACEMEVTLDSTEADKPPTMLGTGGSGTPPEDNLSRVATHNTSTKVRVDSTKLFEVSSFAAALVHGRSIPLIPPGVDLPYIGSIARLRLKPGTVYHRSFAIVSAVIVPTAADIANMLEFSEDLREQRLNTFGELQLIGRPTVNFKAPDEPKDPKKPLPKPSTAPVYYWIVTHYLDGDTVSGPFRVNGAPSPIDADNTVTLAWRAPERALSFDVIRTDDSQRQFDHAQRLKLLIENTTDNTFTDDNDRPLDYQGKPSANPTVLSRITRQARNLRAFHKAMLDCIEDEARGSNGICANARLSKQPSEGRGQ